MAHLAMGWATCWGGQQASVGLSCGAATQPRRRSCLARACTLRSPSAACAGSEIQGACQPICRLHCTGGVGTEISSVLCCAHLTKGQSGAIPFLHTLCCLAPALSVLKVHGLCLHVCLSDVSQASLLFIPLKGRGMCCCQVQCSSNVCGPLMCA